jgi:cell division protein FtsW
MSQASPATLRNVDAWLLGATLALLALGLVMVASSSITSAERATGQPFYFLLRQAAYLGVGLLCALAVWRIRLVYWEKYGAPLLLFGLLLLVLVLVPGVGHAVNGSMRWLPFGPVNLQPSEFAKLLVVIYLAGYLVRHGADVRNSLQGFFRPMALFVDDGCAAAGRTRFRRGPGHTRHRPRHAVSCRCTPVAVWRTA